MARLYLNLPYFLFQSWFIANFFVPSNCKNEDTFTIKTSDLLGKNGNVMSSPVLCKLALLQLYLVLFNYYTVSFLLNCS